MYARSWRRCRPTPTARFFFFASSLAASNLADAGGVDGDRLLHEDVLAGLHRRFEVERAEAGRRGEDHQVARRLSITFL